MWFEAPTIKKLLKLGTLDVNENFNVYMEVFLDKKDLDLDVFKYSHYVYIMGLCSDTDEVLENVDIEDPFEKKKREKMMRKEGVGETDKSIMNTIAVLCMGETGVSYSEILNMNLIEIKSLINEQNKVHNKSKNNTNKSSDVKNVDDMNIRKLK